MDSLKKARKDATDKHGLTRLKVIPKKERNKLQKVGRTPKKNLSNEELLQQIKKLKEQLCGAQETLRAMKSEVDAVVNRNNEGGQVFNMSEAENPYRLLIDQMKEGVVMLSDDNTIIFCNNGFAKMMRSSIDRIIGKYIQNMIPATHMTDFEEFLNQSRTAHAAVGKEIIVEAIDHTLVPTYMSANTLEIENISATFLVLTDLTERMEDKATGE